MVQLSNRSSLLHRYLASVQLATKVIDCETKLRATLLHELCHVATWVLPPHAAKVHASAKDRSCACVYHPFLHQPMLREHNCQVGCVVYLIIAGCSEGLVVHPRKTIANTAQPPHGPDFKRWAMAAAVAHPDLPVTTCHQYDIHVPFHYQCLNPEWEPA